MLIVAQSTFALVKYAKDQESLDIFCKLISGCPLFCSPNLFCLYFQGRNCHCQVF